MRKESPKGKGRNRSQGNYTQIADGQLRGLAAAGASAQQVICYALLTRFHPDDTHPDRCFVGTQLASKKLGLKPKAVNRALNGLCDRWFDVDDNGEAISVLSRTEVDGHKGSVVEYSDNLFRAVVLEATYPHEACNNIAVADKGSRTDTPNREDKGSRAGAPNTADRGTSHAPNATCERGTDSCLLGHEPIPPEDKVLVKEERVVMSNTRDNQPRCNESTSTLVDGVKNETVPLEAYGAMPEYRGQHEPDSTPSFDSVPPVYDTPVSVYEEEVLSELFYGCATAPSSFPTDVWGSDFAHH